MERAAALLTAAVLILSLFYLSGETGLSLAGGGGGGTPGPTKTPGDPTPGKTPTATPTATPTPTADKGCTPGYWKNHTAAWPGAYSPSQTVGSVFSGASAYPTLAGSTLLQALSFGGGPGTEGAARILLRAAVAAVLNAASFGGGYPYALATVIANTNAALASGDRSTMLSLASDLDAANNLGCPLN